MPDILQHVRACGDCPVFLAMTHMRWLSGQRGHESTDHTQGAVLHIDGLRAWPIDRCSNKDAGRSESQTPTFCEQTTGQDKTSTHTQKDHTCQQHTHAKRHDKHAHMTRTYSVFARVTTRHHRNQRASEHGRHTVIGRRYCRLVRNDTFTYSVAPLCRWVVSLSHRYELDTRTRAEVNGRPPIPSLAPRLDQAGRRSRAPSSHGHIVWYDRAVVADVGTVIMLKCSCAQFRSM